MNTEEIVSHLLDYLIKWISMINYYPFVSWYFTLMEYLRIE